MESRYRLLKLLVLKWICYTLLLLLGAALQTAPGFLTIGAAKPVFILPVCVAVACCEGEFRGSWFAVAGGLLWDWTAGRVPGLLTLGLVVICFFSGVVVELILRVNNMNVILLTFVGSTLLLSMDFLFNYVMRRYHAPGQEYLTTVVPIVIFTAAVSPLCMMLTRRIHRCFAPEQ